MSSACNPICWPCKVEAASPRRIIDQPRDPVSKVTLRNNPKEATPHIRIHTHTHIQPSQSGFMLFIFNFCNFHTCFPLFALNFGRGEGGADWGVVHIIYFSMLIRCTGHRQIWIDSCATRDDLSVPTHKPNLILRHLLVIFTR